jgi:antitoxin HicB
MSKWRPIDTALASLMSDNEEIPPPDVSGVLIKMPLLTTLKVGLYEALRSEGLTRAELARRLSWNRESVDRLFSTGSRFAAQPDRGGVQGARQRSYH